MLASTYAINGRRDSAHGVIRANLNIRAVFLQGAAVEGVSMDTWSAEATLMTAAMIAPMTLLGVITGLGNTETPVTYEVLHPTTTPVRAWVVAVTIAAAIPAPAEEASTADRTEASTEPVIAEVGITGMIAGTKGAVVLSGKLPGSTTVQRGIMGVEIRTAAVAAQETIVGAATIVAGVIIVVAAPLSNRCGPLVATHGSTMGVRVTGETIRAAATIEALLLRLPELRPMPALRTIVTPCMGLPR